MKHILNGAVGQSENKTTFYHCGKCDQVVSEKYAINHPKAELDYLFSVEDEDPERKKKSQEQKDKEKEIDDLQENSNEENKEKKVDDLATLKAKLHDLEDRMKDIDDDELNDLLESLRAQLEELEKLKPDPEDKDRDTKQASVEFIGVDTYHSVEKDGDVAAESLVTLQNQRNRKKQSKHGVRPYSVLTFEPYESVTHSGDQLFIRLGSTDEPTKGNAKGDEFLKSLGSVD